MRKIPEDKMEIIRIAVPAVLESLISVVITTIDTRMISPLGSAAVSAVSMTTQPKLIFLSIFFALGTTASAAVGLIYLSRHSDFLTLRGLFSRGETNAEIRKNIVSKSSNVVFENLFTRIGFLISGIIVSTLPADTIAVYFVAMILLNYSFAFGDGLQSTVTMLVGRSMGAGETEKIRKYVRWSRLTGFGIGVVLSVVYILGSRFFFSCFFKDQESISLGMQYSWFAAALSVLQIVRIVNVAAMRGIGNVKIPRIIATICILILNPICGWLLTIVLEKGVWGSNRMLIHSANRL